MRYLFRAIGRLLRFLFVTAGLLAVVMVAAGVGTYFYRTTVATFVLDQLLGFYGYPNARFQIEELSGERTRINSISLGPGGTAVESVTVSYALGDLLAGQLRSVIIDGLHIKADFSATEESSATALNFQQAAAPLFDTETSFAITNSRISFMGTPVGDVDIAMAGEADFAKTPAAFDLTLEAVSLDETASLTAFSFDGGGTVDFNGIDIRGPTEVRFADQGVGGWNIDRLDYNDIAQLHVENKSARFVLSAPIDLGVRQIASTNESGEADPLIVDLQTGMAQIVADWGEGLSGHAEIMGGSAEVRLWRLSANDIHLKVPFERDRISGGSKLRAIVVDTAEATRFHPQRLEATVLRDNDIFLVDANASLVDTPTNITFSGRYSLTEGNGSFDIGPSLLMFSEKGLQPEDVSPLLSNLKNTSGALRLSGNVSVTPDAPPTSNAILAFQEIKTDFSVLSFVGLNGEVRLLDIFDPRSPPGQTLEARRMTAPVPIDGPKIVLQWVKTGNDPVIQIQTAEGKFADGTIRLEPMSFRLAAPENDFTLSFEDLSLKTLFEEWAAGRVSGNGSLSGSIPVTLGADGPLISEGGLVAQDTGFIKVHWGDTRESLIRQGNEVALMVQALDDFQYDQLKVGVRRSSAEDLTLQVLLEGANPEVLEGHPFRINVNLSGNLEDVLTALTTGQAMTEDLLRARVNNAN